MFPTRITKSPLTFLASTCLAAFIATAVCVDRANAWVPEIPMPKCQEEVDKQIAELTALETQKSGELADLEKTLAADQAALAKADAAGEPAIDLARAVADEERAVQNLKDEIQHIDIVIERDKLLALPPCKPPVAAIPGTIPVNGGGVLSGPPIVPPVVDPPPAVDPPYHPTSGFIDPPKKVEPEEPSTWERFKRWCRGVLECQTEEDEKRDHRDALDKARQERRTQTRTEQTGSNTTKATTGHATPTTKVEDHARTATARPNTAHVASVPNHAAVHGPALANNSGVRNAAATRMGGLQTAGLGNHMTGLGAMHPGGLGSLGGARMGGMGGLGGMRMGAMGGMHMGGGMGGMHMGGFARR